MTEKIPLILPDAFAKGPGSPVDLGCKTGDFWLEDNKGNRFKELTQVEIGATQLLHPNDRVKLTIHGIPSNDIMRSLVSGKAFVQFEGYEPIQCLNENNDESESIWIPFREPINIKHSDKTGTEVHFLLFAFPVFYGEHDVRVQEGDDESGKSWWRCGQILLENQNWEIQISAHKETKEWVGAIKETGGLAATHAGCVRKKEKGDISWEEAQHIITCLHYFLSFARGHWQPIGYIRLLTSYSECVQETWGILRGGNQLTQNSLTWWSPHPIAHQLSSVFSGFWKLWNHPSWKDALPEIIYWYLQANLAGRGHLGSESALILSQSTLEKLSWLYGTQIRRAVSEEAFKPGKLRASDQLRLLATLLDLPHEIPANLDAIKEDTKGNKFVDAFHVITEIRNQLVHSKKKRELKPKAEFYAWNLSQWYVEMCLLRIMQYQGHYANRVRLDKWAGETELVPWANPAKENDA